MRIRQVVVRNFRGILEMDWLPSGLLSCLVGAGDSTKTTILDAIEYALSPRWSIPFADVDFHDADITKPIEIKVTVGGLPAALFTEDKFGLCKDGWHPEKGLIDEPTEDDGECEAVLTVALRVSSSLEPEWSVVSDRDQDGRNLSWRDRARFGMVRLGAEIDREFSWNRLSSLTRFTSDSAETDSIIAEVHRNLRRAVESQSMEKLLEAAKGVEKAAKRLGFSPTREFIPRLESRLVGLGMGALSLHDGDIPLALAGLGSRRLVALAIQRTAVPDGAIVLIDEVEHGLEPHRIRRLLRSLARGVAPETAGADRDEPALGQVIMTTHSPTPILELAAPSIHVVRASPEGKTTVFDVPDDLHGTLRFAPYALLGRKILVCEGETEVGLCTGMEEFWQSRNDNESVACKGVVFANGGGRTNAPARALALKALGYEVALLADSDEPIAPDAATLTAAGIPVVQWDGNVSIEGRIALDLPFAVLKELVEQVARERGETSVGESIAAGGIARPTDGQSDLDNWSTANGNCEVDLRVAVGKAAKKGEWYKTIDGGKRLASAISRAFGQMDTSDTAKKLEALEKWCYD
jgi:hypothetical protein